MFSAVTNSASLHTSMQQIRAAHQRQPAIAAANGQPVDAPQVVGAAHGVSRDLAQEQVLSGERPQALTKQYIGPAREMARIEALGLKQLKGIDMATYYQDLLSGCQAGPKTASALQAEAAYLEARKAI